MVRYCPGSANGSPAGLPLNEADRHLVRDTRYVKKMAAMDAIKSPVVFPHIGACPPSCRYYRESGGVPSARGKK